MHGIADKLSAMTTDELRTLLTVLREFGVTEYATDGLSLRIAPARAVATTEQTAPLSPEAAQAAQEAALADIASKYGTRVVDAVRKLPPGYRHYFAVATGDQ